MNQIELIKQHIKERLKLYDPDYVSAGKEFIALLSFIESLEKLEEPECQAYKDAKANNSAYIIEDGWIVRVFADGHKEKIESLEKEQDVDLKKEIVEMMAKQPFFIKAKDQIAFARHFYELGCRHAAVLYDDIEKERQRGQEAEQPQGLDEAAEEFARTTFTQPHSKTPEKEITIIEPDKLAGFKAGAKWMAEQGVSMQVTDDTEWSDVDLFIHRNVTGGTIVQIRKK